MVKTQEEIISDYNLETTKITATIAKTKKQIDKLSFVRVGLFLLAILLFVLFVSAEKEVFNLIFGISILVPIILFALVVKKQSILDREVIYLKQLLWVYQNELNILHDLPNGYDNGDGFASEAHPYSSDLDIFGPSSLFALLNRCSTKNGNHLLASHLAEPVDINLIIQRQEAVKEITSKTTDTYGFRANLYGHDNTKIEQIKSQLKNQLQKQLEFTNGTFFKFYTKIIPYFTIGLVLLTLFVDGVFGNLLGLFLVANIGWTIILNPKVNLVFYGFGNGSNLLNDYAVAVKWTENQNWKSAYILSLFKFKTPVSHEIKSLSKIIQNFDARLNILVGGILNAFLLWDFRCCIKLNQWCKTSSDHVIDALNRIGDFEELISIATVAYNQPKWTFPDIKHNFEIVAVELGHPLINESYRVANSFELEKQPTVDIVTGSNMAGKSTFLRTLGINMVLAYLGAPVCANKMSLSSFKILTYMRIKDSLNESTSTFKAELNRLKMILDQVAIHKNALVLIDEMLRGTNSRDKYLGSKVFIEKLISTKTPALFATHDLQLSELKETHQTAVRNYHFDIQISDGEMKFDYKLKHGACKTFNAAILLKEIGLSLD
ncbi:DNA mismatch repair protein MutS [Pedobacter changchengzhani]|uniref:DNA mismatch repair protein MutS n=1 Tax=Pedobacter changchengzhani TaxID=2529274 RepID=A0A4R5MI79_9SPHI|nr:DNA mismatch repair protein MutS [Pedobacter changchengzhani]TDG35258.1 DNA mismatch repair protein MutS [Pedobacter changchengzhani]